MSQMSSMICNKCFTPIHRGKRPFHITQCGHISCQSCLQQVEKQCPQCQCVGIMSLALQEPLIPKVVPYFQPYTETLEMLLKVETFRSNQMKITLRRFHELDKKYEMLKNQYWQQQHNFKVLMEKYASVKNEKEKLQKKLLLVEMQKGTPRSTHRIETPSDSGISMHQSSSGYSMESLEFQKSSNITPMQSMNMKHYRTADGFRIPSNRRPPKSIGSLHTSSQFV